MLSVPKQELNGQFAMLPMDDVHFGSGSVGKLGAALEQYSVERAVIITGKSLAQNTDLVARVESAAGGRTAGVFFETIAHVPRESVIAAADFARSKQADAIISFGGGTPNDTAKAVAICLAEGIAEPDGLDAVRIKFEYPDKIDIPALSTDPLPMFAVPTTLSAGEFTFFVGITDRARQVKDIYLDKRLTAKSVFLDPDLTLATPERLWLGTGTRAIDHCIEAMCSSTHQPFTDALAYRALSMLVRYLRETKADPTDIAARGQCMVAAWLSVCGLGSVTLGLSHGIGHQLGARCDVPHGETSAVMMHNVMAFNFKETLAQQAWVAEAMGVDINGMSEEEAAAAAASEVLKLVRDDLGLPWRLRDVGVGEDDFDGIASDALQDLVVATNPRKIDSKDQLIELLRTAW
ncbi:MAG: iron-containing alcohol dehydrogenase [Proteobacteria bacterium]|nr:iron-containing alcohol dehydrogenase [Pseudomonadota bacterium]MDA1357444.1 iron-containing alcohol dehydrogenase [Pseudomonadota bacterium]